MSPLAHRILDPLAGLPRQPDPQQTLAHAIGLFPHLAIASSLGPQTLVIIDMLARMNLHVPVFLLDTGFLFPQTLQLKDRVEQRYGLHIETLTPAPDAESPYDTDPDRCCRVRKSNPLDSALVGLDAWITGLRRDHGPSRSSVQPIDWDTAHGLWKVNPLAWWTREAVMAHLRDNDVPYNPLLDQGFRSIGCWPCTRPARPDEDERAGRWAGRGKTECGIHLVDSNPSSDPSGA